MASFGENLRREREMRGVTLEEIAAATKISVRFLGSLESEQFERLPGGVFNRGFLRAYAQYLGLDEGKLLADYGLVHHDGYNVKPLLEAEARKTRIQIVLFVVGCVLVAAGLTGGGIHFARRYGPTILARFTQSADTKAAAAPSGPALPSASSPAETASVPASPETPPPEPAPVVAGQAASVAAIPAGQSSTVAAPPAELDLQIDVIGETRVTVIADGVRQIDRVLHARDSRRVKAKEIIELQSSDSSAVVLTLNGETLPPLGRPGESRSLTLTRKDLKGSGP
jgi:cytoskeleton protein RodZ